MVMEKRMRAKEERNQEIRRKEKALFKETVDILVDGLN